METIIINVKAPYTVNDFRGHNPLETFNNLRAAIGIYNGISSPQMDGQGRIKQPRLNFALWQSKDKPERWMMAVGQRRGFKAVTFTFV